MAFKIFHGYELKAVMFPHIKCFYNIRMPHFLSDSRLADEPLKRLFILYKTGLYDLERLDFPSHAHIPHFIDDAHSASPYEIDHLESPTYAVIHFQKKRIRRFFGQLGRIFLFFHGCIRVN